MKINKKAIMIDNSLRPVLFYQNARTGFLEFLQTYAKDRPGKVLLPAYIGWSPKEGSGVFDPVAEIGLDHVFYRMSDQLLIDMRDVTRCVKENKISVAVIIHYFGYVDPNYEKFVAAVHAAGAVVLEDEAHSMLSDIIGGTCGRLGEASIYSLHKLLPVDKGGVLLLNDNSIVGVGRRRSAHKEVAPYWEYDLLAIARKRRNNAAVLTRMLTKLKTELDILRPVINDGIVPQTLPVLIKRVSRDKLYEVMNSHGYGVVSLYHTMIGQIKEEEFPVSHELSRKILNLPVHQDIEVKELAGLVDCLRRSIAGLRG